MQDPYGALLGLLLTALEWYGAGLYLRPLTLRVPFSVALVEPTLRVEHPLRAAFVGALEEAAGALRERLGRSVGTGSVQ